MTLANFIKYAKSLRADWQNIEIKIAAKNGMDFDPKIKAVMEDDFKKVKHLRITY